MTLALKSDYPALANSHMPPRQRLLLGQRLFKLGKIRMDLSKELQVGSGQQTPIKNPKLLDFGFLDFHLLCRAFQFLAHNSPQQFLQWLLLLIQIFAQRLVD